MTRSLAYRRMLTRMGYYNYQNGLIFRHMNQEGGWEGHLASCRNFIIRALDKYKPSRITVLGSGWLLDLPVAELTERKIQVRLVDIVHPPDVIRQVSKLINIELVEADVTGGLIDKIWQIRRKFPVIKRYQSLKDIDVPEFRLDFDPGMVISLNILTQLESLPLDFIKKRALVREDEVNSLRNKIQEKHINFLNRHNSVLITDYEEDITSRAGDTRIIRTMLAAEPQSEAREEWTWNFDETGADLYNCRSRFKIVALIH